MTVFEASEQVVQLVSFFTVKNPETIQRSQTKFGILIFLIHPMRADEKRDHVPDVVVALDFLFRFLQDVRMFLTFYF